MKRIGILVFAVILFFASGTTSIAAQDTFHVSYRMENVSIAGNIVSGNLLVTIYNVSGGEAGDVEASIPHANNVTFDNRTIFIGNLADGQRVEVLNTFSVPIEIKGSDEIDEIATWNVEYTDKAGERNTVSVTGHRIQ